ncbi:uncharacterized protein B0H18DRAFT_119539 [Fomitopsis serialis]|uniref:uncharacterized protein n=1 Tax=Fomitopsis serialis TaxID=139415 RepID=UPI0020081FAD|nr:uncharacterized protein B0H18DRAFT_119539 [Neoantrodia serialis]KAH9930940.1 hypothetical protein B0H18DRAFT_119539 [Neoantrodia serialis]
MCMFSTITLTGAHIPDSVTLSRRETFPARQYDFHHSKLRNRPGWIAAELPKHSGHLALELGERIGGGRSAVVYSAKVVTAVPGVDCGSSSRTTDPSKQEFCVKVARPNRCRSLAREAWMYEQLTENIVQGVITPRCYGLFAAVLPPEQLPFPLWTSDDYYRDASPGHWESDDPTRDDALFDDKDKGGDCIDSPPGARELSSWVDWRPNPDVPLLSVLVMARAGRKYSLADDDWVKSNQRDVVQILDDLSLNYIMHRDFRPDNIVLAPADTRKCKVHKRVHKWNIIDFAWSVVDDPSSPGKYELISDMQRASFRNLHFTS